MTLAFRVLGPLEVVRDGERVRLGGERQHALLALLLMRANQVVASEWILEELFREAARDPANALQVAVSRLRRALGDGVLETRPRGYLLRVEPGELDRDRFEQHAEEGRRKLAAADSEGAASMLRDALGLWRGSPLQEVALLDFAQPEIRRLEELRLATAMDLIDAQLALGESAKVVPELERIIRENPFQERPRGQLMLALYRSGRQAEALDVYRDTRELLLDELGLEPSRALQQLERAILNQDATLEPLPAAPAVDAVCPFKGLAPYGRDDADFFCGREALVAETIGRLAGSSFVAIVGASGAGKSSLLRAGVLPALAAGALPGSSNWPATLVRPGEQLGEVARIVGVDQLEELFEFPREQRDAFLDELVAATEKHIVLVCLRADFYGRFGEHRPFAELLTASQVLVGPLDAGELRRTIVTPAARAGLEVEQPLVDALIRDAENQAGALPLLSTTLLELWSLRGDNFLRLETYRAAGGIDGAVARLAERAYRRLDPADRDEARRLLLRLTSETDGVPVRRRVPLSELQPERTPRALAILVEARLVTVDGGFAEVAHEALLREWPRLRDWLEEDADGRRLHRQLTADAQAWRETGEMDDALYRGARLATALAWAASHHGDANEIEQAFLAASRRAAQRTLRRLRLAAAVLAGLLLAALVAGAVALIQRQAARRDARLALAGRVAAQALAEQRVDRALLLSSEAIRLDDSAQTERSLLENLMRSPALVASYTLPEATRPYRVTLSPDARTLVIGDSNGAIRFFDVGSQQQTRPAFTHAMGYGPTTFTDSGRELLTVADPPRGLQLLNAKSLGLLRRLPFDAHFSADKAGAVTPMIASGDVAFFAYDLVIDQRGDEGPAFLDRWDLRTGSRKTTRLGSTNVIGAGVARGDLVTVTSDDLETWDPRTLTRVHSVRPSVRLGGYASVDPRGRFVAALSHFGGTLVFLDLRNGRATAANGDSAGVLALSFSPDGSSVATAGSDGTVRLWNPATGELRETFTGHGAAANGVAFAPDGRTLYASGLDGSVLAWTVDPRRRFGVRFRVPRQPRDLPGVPQTPPAAVIAGALVVRDGNGIARCSLSTFGCAHLARSDGALVTAVASRGPDLAVGRRDGTVELWKAGRRLRVLRGLGKSIQGVAFTRAGEIAAADTQALAFWRVGRRDPVRRLRLAAPVTTFAADPGGARFAVGLRDGRILVGDEEHTTTIRSGGEVVSLAFLTDGTLTSGTFDGALERWGPGDGRRIASVATRAGPVASIAQIPRENAILTSSLTSGDLLEWSADRLLLLARFSGDPFALTRVLADGTDAIAVFDDGAAVVWPLRPTSWEQRACAIVRTNLSRGEWQQLLPNVRYEPTCKP